MMIGYARVSTADQDAALQRDALTREGCERILEEPASGGKTDRAELARALDVMRAGDTLVVWKLDRLARSMKQLIETITRLEEAGVQFRSITEQIDTSTPGGKLTFHIFGALADFEQALIRERTRAGLASARARGRKGGRPRRLTADDIKLAETLLAGNHGVLEVAKQLKVSRATLFRRLKENRTSRDEGEAEFDDGY